jgi:hypothetical protein
MGFLSRRKQQVEALGDLGQDVWIDSRELLAHRVLLEIVSQHGADCWERDELCRAGQRPGVEDPLPRQELRGPDQPVLDEVGVAMIVVERQLQHALSFAGHGLCSPRLWPSKASRVMLVR